MNSLSVPIPTTKKQNKRKQPVTEDIPTTSDQELPPCAQIACAQKKKRQRQSDQSGKKKHWCPTCNQGFTRLQGLKKHLGHFVFECPECGLSVKSKWNLDRHMRSHMGVKPFPCQVPDCSRLFADKSALTKHMSKTHKNPSPLRNGDEKYGKPKNEVNPMNKTLRVPSPSHLNLNQLTISSPPKSSTREFEQSAGDHYGNAGINLPTFSNTGFDKVGLMNIKKEYDDICSGFNTPEESFKLTEQLKGQRVNNELLASMPSLIEAITTLRKQTQRDPSTCFDLFKRK